MGQQPLALNTGVGKRNHLKLKVERFDQTDYGTFQQNVGPEPSQPLTNAKTMARPQAAHAASWRHLTIVSNPLLANKHS